MTTLLSLHANHWFQASKSIIGLSCKDGECVKECKKQEVEVCCAHFKGCATLSKPEHVSDEQVFYYFNLLEDPSELLQLFRARNFFMALMSTRNGVNLSFEQQLSMVNILDGFSIQALLLRALQDKSVNLAPILMISMQAECAVFYGDWTRYAKIVNLWEACVVSCLMLDTFATTQEKCEMRKLLKHSFHVFAIGTQPEPIFKQIINICSLLEPVVGEDFFVDILEARDGLYARFCTSYAMHKFMSMFRV